jgi:hypothetical protein
MLRDEHDYQGSVDLVRRKLSTLRPREERAAQRTGYRAGQVVQLIGVRYRPVRGSRGWSVGSMRWWRRCRSAARRPRTSV